MERGYIKLYRKILDTGIIQNPHALQLFCYLLLTAAHKPISRDVRGEMVSLNPGQIIIGRQNVSKILNISEKNVRTALKYLEKNEIVAIKATKRYTLISIINWDTYQNNYNDMGQQNGHEAAMRGPCEGHEAAMKRPTSGHETATVKELKNIKKERIKELKNLNTNSSEQTSCSEHFLLQPIENNTSDNIFIDIPLNDGTSYFVKAKSVELWQELFPACDVKQELRSMKAWSLSNPKRRKTRKGIERHITGWLENVQNKPRPNAPVTVGKTVQPPKTFSELEKEQEEKRRNALLEKLKAMQDENDGNGL